MGAKGHGGDPDARRHGHGGRRVPAVRPRPGARRARARLGRGADDGGLSGRDSDPGARPTPATPDRGHGGRHRHDRRARRIPPGRGRARRPRPAHLLRAGVLVGCDGGAGRPPCGHRARGAERAGDRRAPRRGTRAADRRDHGGVRRGIDGDGLPGRRVDVSHGSGQRHHLGDRRQAPPVHRGDGRRRARVRVRAPVARRRAGDVGDAARLRRRARRPRDAARPAGRLRHRIPDRHALGALVAFLVTVADVGILGIGAPFWGLVLGAGVAALLERGGPAS